ncbi:hypothetical protein AB0N67_24730 [Streptomyces microflavus]
MSDDFIRALLARKAETDEEHRNPNRIFGQHTEPTGDDPDTDPPAAA